MSNYTCTVCKESKPIIDFHKDCTAPRGHKVRCKPCCISNMKYKTPCEYKRYGQTLNGRLSRLAISSRQSANKKSFKCELTLDNLLELWYKQGGRCSKTKFKLTLDVGTQANKNPRGPSIDRINNDKGYTLDNIQLVCIQYNLAKNRFTDEDTLEMAKALVENKGE